MTETGKQPGSKDPVKQRERLNQILAQGSNATSYSDKIVLVWDANIDLNPENNTNERYDVKLLAEDYMEFMDTNNFVLVNEEPTRHWSGTKSSLIDHFVTNCASHIDNIITQHSCIADHDLVSILFHTEIIQDKPQFRMTRNWTNLTRDN